MSRIERVVTYDSEVMAERGRRGAAIRNARHDPSAFARRAHAAFLRKFEYEIDPAGALPPDERQRRGREAMRAHMRRLAAASAQARRQRAEGVR